jgi:hypothetical protein
MPARKLKPIEERDPYAALVLEAFERIAPDSAFPLPVYRYPDLANLKQPDQPPPASAARLTRCIKLVEVRYIGAAPAPEFSPEFSPKATNGGGAQP